MRWDEFHIHGIIIGSFLGQEVVAVGGKPAKLSIEEEQRKGVHDITRNCCRQEGWIGFGHVSEGNALELIHVSPCRRIDREQIESVHDTHESNAHSEPEGTNKHNLFTIVLFRGLQERMNEQGMRLAKMMNNSRSSTKDTMV